MNKLKQFFLIIFVVISSNVSLIHAGLLPDNIVITGPNQCCKIKNLRVGDWILASGSTRYNLRERYCTVDGIKINGDSTNVATLITLESENGIISSLMVGEGQRFCVTHDKDSRSFEWTEAHALELESFILGYENKIFKITGVQKIDLGCNTDLYEMSLNPNETFYVLDSNGNPILTHNVIGILGWILIGALTVK